jgi:hypothetical protein
MTEKKVTELKVVNVIRVTASIRSNDVCSTITLPMLYSNNDYRVTVSAAANVGAEPSDPLQNVSVNCKYNGFYLHSKLTLTTRHGKNR